jgi:outer membrane protein OmpA-like peptidoglycan-associated protein
MKHKSKVWNGIAVGVLGCVIALPLFGVEILTKEDLVKNVVKKEQLVRVADNAIFLLDTSSSMNGEFGDTKKPKIQAVQSELEKRNSYFPEIGHKMGIFTYTPWEVIYPTQLYDRQKVAAALATVRKEGRGPTPLKAGLKMLDDVVKPLTGRTAVFLFSDGEYTGDDPSGIAKNMARAYDVCFYVISTAKPGIETTVMQDIASVNACSRVIPLADFVNHAEYTSGALFDVKVTEHVVTTTDTKIIGLKVDNMNFTFNGTELAAKDQGELDKLAEFMKGHPKSYAVIAGYTDDIGTKDYNEGLSRGRAEMVGRYLKEKHGIADSRMVLVWYGHTNPIVANDTPENRAKNRRVEINVGLGE